MSYSAEERESSFVCNDETKTWDCYVLMPTVITKFRKAGFKPTEVKSDGAHVYRGIPFSSISIRAKSERTMSDENKAKAAERLRAAKEAKSK